MPNNQATTSPDTPSAAPAPTAKLPDSPAASEAPPSTATVVESALEQVEQNLADVSAALDNLEPASDQASTASLEDPASTDLGEGLAAVNEAKVPGLEDSNPAEPADVKAAESSQAQAAPALEQKPPAAAGNPQSSDTLACRVLRPFVGMLTLMDVPFSGTSQESKSIIGHIAIATMLVAVATWVLRWCGYLQ